MLYEVCKIVLLIGVLALGLQQVSQAQTCPVEITWCRVQPGLLKIGQKAEVTAWLWNSTGQGLAGVEAALQTPAGVSTAGASSEVFDLGPMETKRLNWEIAAGDAGSFPLQLLVKSGDSSISVTRTLTVVSKRDPKREFQAADDSWQPFPSRPTLQQGNTAKLRQLEALPSSQLKRNLFGITAHLPRKVNDEDPYEARHIIDGDPDTCWASRWWRTRIPFEPEWAKVDLGRTETISEVRLLPAWENSGAPVGFRIQVSRDGREWTTVREEVDYKLQSAPDGDPLRHGNLTWQRFSFPERTARFVRIEATRLDQSNTYFFCAPASPFQLRIAELAFLDARGGVVDLRGAKATASTTHTAWYNTPETVTKTWALMLNSGVKLNRIGQWGDKTDWAAVEKKKGVLAVDPEVDRRITESVQAGVDILMTLDYGNNLYQTVLNAPGRGPTWMRGHPFMQCAPTTPEAIAGFVNYCAFMAAHFRGRVKYFEIWNEEDGWFFDNWDMGNDISMVRTYGRVLAAAAKAIKEANPEAKVVFGGIAGSSLDYVRIAMEEGAGPYIDVVAFHPYGHPYPEAAPGSFLTEVNGKMDWRPIPAEIKDYEQEIAAYKALMRKYNRNIQVWADEMNWFAPGEPPLTAYGDQSDFAQAKYLSRFFALNSWLDCGAVWWSLYNANGIQEWAIVRSADMSPRPAYYSAGYVATLLDDVCGVNIKTETVGDAPADLMIKSYRSGLGDLLVGLWRKSQPDDNCKPTPVTLRMTGVDSPPDDIVDVVYGYRQPVVSRREGGSVEIPGILVGDWPVFVRFKGR